MTFMKGRKPRRLTDYDNWLTSNINDCLMRTSCCPVQKGCSRVDDVVGVEKGPAHHSSGPQQEQGPQSQGHTSAHSHLDQSTDPHSGDIWVNAPLLELPPRLARSSIEKERRINNKNYEITF